MTRILVAVRMHDASVSAAGLTCNSGTRLWRARAHATTATGSREGCTNPLEHAVELRRVEAFVRERKQVTAFAQGRRTCVRVGWGGAWACSGQQQKHLRQLSPAFCSTSTCFMTYVRVCLSFASCARERSDTHMVTLLTLLPHTRANWGGGCGEAPPLPPFS